MYAIRKLRSIVVPTINLAECQNTCQNRRDFEFSNVNICTFDKSGRKLSGFSDSSSSVVVRRELFGVKVIVIIIVIVTSWSEVGMKILQITE